MHLLQLFYILHLSLFIENISILDIFYIFAHPLKELSCFLVITIKTFTVGNFIRKTFGIRFSSWVKQNRTRLLLCSRWNKCKFRRHSFYLRMREILTGNKDFICILFDHFLEMVPIDQYFLQISIKKPQLLSIFLVLYIIHISYM